MKLDDDVRVASSVEDKHECVLCGSECEDGWGWILTEFFDIYDPYFESMEKIASELEKKPLCKEHLLWLFQVIRDFLAASGDIPAFLDKVRTRL